MSYFSTLVFQGSDTDFSATTTYSFTGKAIGTAKVSRVVVVGVMTTASAGDAVVPAVTVGGIAATMVAGGADVALGFTNTVHVAVVPTGTTATIDAVFGTAQSGCVIQWLTFVPVSATPLYTNFVLSVGATTFDAAVETITDGLGLVFTTVPTASTPTVTYSSMTDTLFNQASGVSLVSWSVDAVFPSVTSTTDIFTTTTTTAQDASMVVVAFDVELSLDTTVTEGVFTTDVFAVRASYGQTATDAVKLNLSHEKMQAEWGVTASGGIGVAPTLALAYRPGAIVLEALRAAETYAANTVRTVSSEDVVRLADALLAGVPRDISDTIGVAETLSLVRGALVAEALGLTDVLGAATTYGLTQTDALRLRDTLQRFLGGGLLDTIGVDETDAPFWRLIRSASDTIGVQATLTPKLLLRVTTTDAIDLTATEALQWVFSPVVVDGIQIDAGYVEPNGSVTTWAVNTNTGAVTEYTNYDFNSFAQIGLKYLGASSTGLYELIGDDDAGTDIIGQIKSGLLQFSGSRFTGFKAAYLGMRGTGDVLLKLVTGDGLERVYQVTVDDMRTTRVMLGKGIRARYFSFELVSTGQDFDVDTIEFVPISAQRRV